MYCIKCGKQIPDNAQFCPFCGQACPPVDTQTVPTDTTAENITPRLTADMPATTEGIAPETADSAAVPESSKEEQTAASLAEPVLESAPAPSEDPAAQIRNSHAQKPVTSVKDSTEKKQPLLKWLFIGLGAVACVALVLVIWTVASHANTPAPSIKTVSPQSSISGNATQPGQTPQTPSTTPETTVPSVTPKVTIPNVTPKVTVPNTTPTVPSTTPKSPEDAVPKEGETLYVGHSSYDDISDVKLRFILSEDHTKIHDISITCEGLSGKIQSSTSNTNVSISKVTQMFQGQFPVDYSGTTTGIKLGSSTITSLTFSGETARAELDYTYHMTRTGTNVQDMDIPFGTTWFDLSTEK